MGPWICALVPARPPLLPTWVNDLPENDLADLIFRFGEDRNSRRIARAIVNGRPYSTTRQLAQAIEKGSGPGTTGFTRPPAPSRPCASRSTMNSKGSKKLCPKQLRPWRPAAG